jgi:V8-like Glu-specific endopeptidase
MEPETIDILKTPSFSEIQSSFENTDEFNSEHSNIEINSSSSSLSNTTNYKSSHVWLHFIKDENFKSNKKAHCKYCNKTYICSKGSTSTISNHLNKFHATKLRLSNSSQKNNNIWDIFQNTKVNIYLLFINFILNKNN